MSIKQETSTDFCRKETQILCLIYMLLVVLAFARCQRQTGRQGRRKGGREKKEEEKEKGEKRGKGERGTSLVTTKKFQ